MRTTCQFMNPDQMRVSITVETTLAQWREIRNALDKNEPHYTQVAELRREIRDVIEQVEDTFSAQSPVPSVSDTEDKT
jgi:hypothetical protein